MSLKKLITSNNFKIHQRWEKRNGNEKIRLSLFRSYTRYFEVYLSLYKPLKITGVDELFCHQLNCSLTLYRNNEQNLPINSRFDDFVTMMYYVFSIEVTILGSQQKEGINSPV